MNYINRVVLLIAISILFAAGDARADTNKATDDILNAITEFVVTNSPWDKDQLEINIINISPKKSLPPGGIISDISYRGKPLSYSQRKSFKIFSVSTSGKIATFNVIADIKVSEMVVITAQSLKASHIIKPGDIFLAKRKITKGDNIYSIDEILGKSTKKTLKANAIIKASSLEQPVIVDKNDKVTILFQSENLRIATIGIAKAKGKEGKTIPVMNIDSGKTIYGKVINSNTILIEQ